MRIKLSDARAQARQLAQAGDLPRALAVHDSMLAQNPLDYDARLRIGELLARLELREAASAVLRAVALHDIRSGHPLPAVSACRALESLGQPSGDLMKLMADLYAADSGSLARFAARQAPVDAASDLDAPDLTEREPLPIIAERARKRAMDLSAFVQYPEQFHPLPFFSELPRDVFAAAVAVLRARRFGPGEAVIREGEPGTAFYLVASGEVRVYATDSLGRQNELVRLHENALFGEMALLTEQPRTASVEAVGEADILELGRDALTAVAAEVPSLAAALDRFARERLLKNLLATSPLFKPFTRQQQMDLIRRFDGHDVAPGTLIIREGEAGRGLFVVLSGEVEVSKQQPGGENLMLARLKSGDVFGEMSLLNNQPTSATVHTVKQSTILFLAREYFQRLVAALPEIRSYFEQLSQRRDLENRLTLAADQPIEVDEDMMVML